MSDNNSAAQSGFYHCPTMSYHYPFGQWYPHILGTGLTRAEHPVRLVRPWPDHSFSKTHACAERVLIANSLSLTSEMLSAVRGNSDSLTTKSVLPPPLPLLSPIKDTVCSHFLLEHTTLDISIEQCIIGDALNNCSIEIYDYGKSLNQTHLE